MNGKGSGRRPQLESDEVVASRWDAIFRKPAQGSATPEESGEHPRTDTDDAAE